MTSRSPLHIGRDQGALWTHGLGGSRSCAQLSKTSSGGTPTWRPFLVLRISSDRPSDGAIELTHQSLPGMHLTDAVGLSPSALKPRCVAQAVGIRPQETAYKYLRLDA